MKAIGYYQNDQELLTGLKNEENASYEFLYRNYFRMIEDFIIRNNGSYDDARDVFQESVIALTEKLHEKNLELTSSFKTFFFSMCRFNWLNKLRNYSKFTKISETHEELVDVQNEEINSDVRIQGMSLILELGEKCQEILRLFYYKKLSMVEIAKEMKYTNAENVKVQKYKCLEQLKKKIKFNIKND